MSSVGSGMPVVDPSDAAIAIAKELIQPKKTEQPKDTVAEIMDAEAQRDRNIAIAVGVIGGWSVCWCGSACWSTEQARRGEGKGCAVRG